MNSLKREVEHKKEKRELELQKQNEEVKPDLIAEGLGLIGIIVTIIFVYYILKGWLL
jgi:hypothetical protein